MKDCSHVAVPDTAVTMRPRSLSRRLPLGHVVVEWSAGARDVKTSARWEPVDVAVASRVKTISQVLPAAELGISKVTRVVISGVLPVFWTRPKLLPYVTAPVQTLYNEVATGKMVLPDDGLAGACGFGVGAARQEVAPRMAAAMAAVNFMLAVDS